MSASAVVAGAVVWGTVACGCVVCGVVFGVVDWVVPPDDSPDAIAPDVPRLGSSVSPSPMSSGSNSWKSPVSKSAVADCMNFRQISAGNVPPWTLMPCTLSMGLRSSG